MLTEFLNKLKESIFSIVPLTAVVVVLSFIFVPTTGLNITRFLISAVLLIFGICLFNIGADMAMTKMGGYIGSHLSKSKKIELMLVFAFLIGVIVTFAEPDLTVLASQIPGLDKWVVIITVSLGTGIFLLLAILKIIFRIKMKTILAIAYGVAFILMFFVPSQFIPIAFDASGVTTGPISVPFIMAFGLGITAVRSKESADDSFGLLAICSIGPIIAILIMSLFLNGDLSSTVTTVVALPTSFASITEQLLATFLSCFKEVALILLPIVVFFLINQFSFLHFPIKQLARLGVGTLYTFFGISLFFVGVEVGFLPMAMLLGSGLAGLDYNWVLIPVALLLGSTIILAEPAVHVLNKQVEDLSSGVISKKLMFITLSIGVALSVGLSVMRIVLNIDLLYMLVPIVIACLILAFFNPQMFTAVAFDSGGVAAGSLSTSFVLPFMQGVCVALGYDVVRYSFGAIALIALMPILCVQIVGFISTPRASKRVTRRKAVTIIEFD